MGIGYKVVLREGDKYFSAFPKLGNPVEYAVNMVTERPMGSGPLGIFNTLADAIGFAQENVMGHYRPFTIFKAQYTKSRKRRFMCIWSMANYNIIRYDKGPKGTVYAERIKLLEKVWSN